MRTLTLARRTRTLALMAVIAAAILSGFGLAPARAATDTGATTANVVVGTSITLTDLTPAFTLTGVPGDTVTTAAPVTMLITTNNVAGYNVTVQPATTSLVGAVPGNTDVIPFTDLQVRETGGGPFTALTPATPLQVFTQAAPSAAEGDTISNDYSLTIPFVAPDTYTGTLNYVATTL